MKLPNIIFGLIKDGNTDDSIKSLFSVKKKSLIQKHTLLN
jgi:hypothetical protein